MKHLELSEKMAVAHCVYQLLASAEGAVDEERDYDQITLTTDTLGISIYSWDRATTLNPHDCFRHVSEMTADKKDAFCKLLFQLCEGGTNIQRKRICAESICVLCGIEPANKS